jgi:hypothetical protein
MLTPKNKVHKIFIYGFYFLSLCHNNKTNKIMATKAQVVELQNRIDELQSQLEKEKDMHEAELAHLKAQVEKETLHAYKEKVISFFGDELKEFIAREIKENLQLNDEMNYGYGSDRNTLDLTLVYKDKVLGDAAIYQ